MEKYKELISTIGHHLKLTQWQRKSNTFYLIKGDIIALIDFQKSKSSNKNEIKFTINLGIASNSIRRFQGHDTTRIVQIEDCHWKNRVGFLMPMNKDYWWEISENTSIRSLTTDIIQIIDNQVISEISNWSSDEKLEMNWLKGNAGGLTELQMFMYLTTLLKIYNKPNLQVIVNGYLQNTKNVSYISTVKLHLKEIGITLQ
jgi:hypothetical protein